MSSLKTVLCFCPLYRGTWFLTARRGTVKAILIRFHPLYRGTWFLTGGNETKRKRRLEVSIRYIAVLGFQQPPRVKGWVVFPSAISRYLVSNYRLAVAWGLGLLTVSIRYIAVLGFQR